MLHRFIAVVCFSSVLAACQSIPETDMPVAETTVPEKGASQEFFQPKPPAARPARNAPDDLWERIRRELTWQSIHNEQIGHARRFSRGSVARV